MLCKTTIWSRLASNQRSLLGIQGAEAVLSAAQENVARAGLGGGGGSAEAPGLRTPRASLAAPGRCGNKFCSCTLFWIPSLAVSTQDTSADSSSGLLTGVLMRARAAMAAQIHQQVPATCAPDLSASACDISCRRDWRCSAAAAAPGRWTPAAGSGAGALNGGGPPSRPVSDHGNPLFGQVDLRLMTDHAP